MDAFGILRLEREDVQKFCKRIKPKKGRNVSILERKSFLWNEKMKDIFLLSTIHETEMVEFKINETKIPIVGNDFNMCVVDRDEKHLVSSPLVKNKVKCYYKIFYALLVNPLVIYLKQGSLKRYLPLRWGLIDEIIIKNYGEHEPGCLLSISSPSSLVVWYFIEIITCMMGKKRNATTQCKMCCSNKDNNVKNIRKRVATTIQIVTLHCVLSDVR